MMQKLVNYHSNLAHGTVFRFPGSYPHEKYVDLILVEFPDSDRKFGLVVSTGHKAGLILIKLPKEAESNNFAGIDRQWVIDNWNKWIYETCNVDDVYVIQNYPIPAIDYSKP